MEKVELKLSELTKMVNDGLSKKEIAKKISLSINSVTSLLKEANLKCKKDCKKYRLIDDINVPVASEVQEALEEPETKEAEVEMPEQAAYVGMPRSYTKQ